MRHVTHENNKSFDTSHLIYQGVIIHTWLLHSTHMNAPWHTFAHTRTHTRARARARAHTHTKSSHIWLLHSTHTTASCHNFTHTHQVVTHLTVAQHTYDCIMSQFFCGVTWVIFFNVWRGAETWNFFGWTWRITGGMSSHAWLRHSTHSTAPCHTFSCVTGCCGQKAYIWKKELYFSSNEPYIPVKESHISAKEPYVSVKEPYILKALVRHFFLEVVTCWSSGVVECRFERGSATVSKQASHSRDSRTSET